MSAGAAARGLRGFIFDVDGTLADTVPICVEAFRRTVLAHAGRDMQREEIVSLFGPTEEGMLRRVLAGSFAAALPRYLAEYARLHESVAAPFPGLDGALRRLRGAGAPLAVVTGKGARTTELSLRALGLDGLFAPVETGSDDAPIKDRCIARVLAHWRLPPRRVAYVGDAPADVSAARAAGVVAVAAAWAPGADAAGLARAGPDALFETVADFADWAQAALGCEGVGSLV
jgi:phosphoglycolate phosphatase-like HAD superfamily hydrolase